MMQEADKKIFLSNNSQEIQRLNYSLWGSNITTKMKKEGDNYYIFTSKSQYFKALTCGALYIGRNEVDNVINWYDPTGKAMNNTCDLVAFSEERQRNNEDLQVEDITALIKQNRLVYERDYFEPIN